MQVNGEFFDFKQLNNNSLIELISHLKLKQERIAVEINGEICSKSNYENQQLNDSDKVEIIHFVGGG